jgi:hypothetical protein
MCAMKEVTLFSDDAKSKESAKQLMQVSWLRINNEVSCDNKIKFVACRQFFYCYYYSTFK